MQLMNHWMTHLKLMMHYMLANLISLKKEKKREGQEWQLPCTHGEKYNINMVWPEFLYRALPPLLYCRLPGLPPSISSLNLHTVESGHAPELSLSSFPLKPPTLTPSVAVMLEEKSGELIPPSRRMTENYSWGLTDDKTEAHKIWTTCSMVHTGLDKTHDSLLLTCLVIQLYGLNTKISMKPRVLAQRNKLFLR